MYPSRLLIRCPSQFDAGEVNSSVPALQEYRGVVPADGTLSRSPKVPSKVAPAGAVPVIALWSPLFHRFQCPNSGPELDETAGGVPPK